MSRYDAMGLGRDGEPWEQLRQRLAISKAHGVRWPTAWKGAQSRCLAPHDRELREWWYEVVRDPTFVEHWRLAYEDEPDPISAVLSRFA